MKINTFKASFVNREKILSLEEFTSFAKLKMKDYEKNNLVEIHDQEVILVYEIKIKNKSYSGLVAMTSSEDYEKLLGHEKTLSFKEEELLKIATAFKTMLKPVLLAYHSTSEIELLIHKTKMQAPLKFIAGDKEHECHTFWEVKEMDYVKDLFTNIERAYIADGHHRYSLHLSYKKNKNLDLSNLLCYYISFDQIDIKAFNRGLSVPKNNKDILNQIMEYCEISELEKMQKPLSKSSFTILYNEKCYLSKWKIKYKSTDLYDIELFNQLIVTNVFKIEDHRNNLSIKYYEGDKNLKELKKISIKEEEMIFIFYPVDKNDLIRSSDEKKFLPPKSTWFMPRVKSGIITCKF